MMDSRHVAFSDDSSHREGRYNGLSIVTLEKCYYRRFRNRLQEILEDSGVRSEFKWEKLKNAKYRFVAEKFIEFVFRRKEKLRIDTIIWDLEDSRHKNVLGRDDEENLVRMYYHLVSTTLSKRWPIEGCCWKWHPDIQSSVDWVTLQDCINNKKHKCVKDLFHENPDFERVNLSSIKPSNSIRFPFIQLADFFAGMGSYSCGHFDIYEKWELLNNPQKSLFYSSEELSFSNSEEERCRIIKKFNTRCKRNNLQIAFKTTRGFRSYQPDNFLNFWFYKPQSKNDICPTK